MGISVWGSQGSCTRSLWGWLGWSVGVPTRSPSGGWVSSTGSLPGSPRGVPVCRAGVLCRGRADRLSSPRRAPGRAVSAAPGAGAGPAAPHGACL